MKRIILILALLLTWAGSAFSQGYVEIGSGTTATSYPVYSMWNYAWYAFILPQSDVGTSKTITQIAVYCNNGPKTSSNQRIYMKHTSNSVFSSAAYDDPGSNGYTLVYDGTVSFNGWSIITLSAPFAYNGTDNLLIQWESRAGSYNYASFNSTASVVNNNKGAGSDTGFPTSSGYLNPYPSSVPNIRLYYPSASPATPDNPSPANDAENTDLNTALSFTLGANTTQYDVYLGTDSLQIAASNPSYLVVTNAAAAAPGNYSYSPASVLSPGTTCFWRVVAKDGSSVTASPVWKFTTQNVIQNFPYNQGFEGTDVIYPGMYGMYTDWTYPVSGSNMIWYLCDSANAHSGNAGLQGSPASGTTTSAIMTPRIFLPAAHRVGFWWRNGDYLIKTGSSDTTFFEITSNGGTTWVTLDTLCPAVSQSVMSQVSYDLSAHAGNNVYLRWRYVKASAAADNIYIDDIRIEAIPTGAVMLLNTSAVTFGNISENAHTHIPVIISNTGVADLVITGCNSTAPFSCSYTGTIQPGSSDTAVIDFTGTVQGNYSSALNFVSNGTGSGVVTVSGTVLPFYGDFFETFESVSTETIPAGWMCLHSSSSLHNALVKNSPSDAVSVPNVVRMYNNTDTVTPLILLTPGVTGFDTDTLSFYAAKSYGNLTTVGLEIGLMDDPYDPSSFTLVQTFILTDTQTKYVIAFDPLNTKPYLAFRHAGMDELQSIWIDNVRWEGAVSSVPGAATLVFPADSSLNNETDVVLEWAPSTGSPTGYRLYFGTANPPVNIINGQDLGDTTRFLIQNLNYAATYFWKVVPYNIYGDAVGCPVWNFKVMNDPTLYIPWSEGFEGAAQTSGYDKPLGWSNINGNDQFMGWDLIQNSAMSPDNAHTGTNAMHTGFTFLNPLNDWLITPPVMLTGGVDYSFSFWLKAPYYIESGDTTFEKFEVLWGNDKDTASLNQVLFMDDFLRQPDYTRISQTITPTVSGKYWFAFHSKSDPLQWLVMIDDVAMDFANTIPAGEELSIRMYPVPAQNHLFMHSENMAAGDLICVYDSKGVLVLSQIARGHEERIDVSSLNAGVYCIVVNGLKTTQGRFIKQ